MKEPSTKRKWIGVYLILLLGVLTIALIVASLYETNRLRKFKSDLFMLTNDSATCIAKGPEGLIRVDSANLPALYALVDKAKGELIFGDPEALDSVQFDFSCHEKNWGLTVDLISDKAIRIHMEGEREYVVYIENKNSFENFLKAAAIDSFNVPNKKMK